jgi:IS5 family transposase
VKVVHGYNAGVSVDKGTGFILKVVVAPANVHDTGLFDPLLPGGVKEVYGDKGFDSAERTERLRENGIIPRIMFKGKRGRKLSNIERYAGMKRYCGLRRMMWMGLGRAQTQAELSAIALNCKRAALALRA